MIIYPDGGGHIILNYKKISREYSFSRGGSNTETNASPLLILLLNGVYYSRIARLEKAPVKEEKPAAKDDAAAK
jgi:hypothetical protein